MTDVDAIWKGDHLGRREEALYLSNFLTSRYLAKREEKGFVLVVNGNWGMGKTFLIDRWSQQLKFEGHPVVKFDAWENDYSPSPLIAFISVLDDALESEFKKMPRGEELRQEWFAKAKAVLVPTVKLVGYAAVKHGLGMGMDQFSAVMSEEGSSPEQREFDADKLGERLDTLVEEALKTHSNTKHAVAAFKEKLSKLVEFLGKAPGVHLPIFIFIDELDRCRPDYAIQLLEGIKHLFGIPGLYFVVSMNMSELAHSVCAVYGSGFSSDRYLKRFFDMEYALPSPSARGFAVELMRPVLPFITGGLITGLERELQDEAADDRGIPFIFSRYALFFELELRDQQQVARVLEVALIALKGTAVHIHFLIFLAMLYQKSASTYHSVARAFNLTEPTGFGKACPPNGEGFFTIYDHGADGAKKVMPVEVANVYLNELAGTALTAPSDMAYFPRNLTVKIRQHTGGVNLLKTYFDIVRRAGRVAR